MLIVCLKCSNNMTKLISSGLEVLTMVGHNGVSEEHAKSRRLKGVSTIQEDYTH